MAITAAESVQYLSGGSANTNPAASLGGARSTTEVSTSLHNLFPQITGSQSAVGGTFYACIYQANTNATLLMQATKAYISSNTPSAFTAVRIAVGTSAIGGTEQTVASPTTAPTGVTWSTAVDAANAVSLGDIPVGSHRALWVELTVTAGAPAYNDDQCTLTFLFDTAA